MQRRVVVGLTVAVVVGTALAFFTPQGAVRRCLAGRGDVLDALTVTVERGNLVDFGGQQYYVRRYRTEEPAGRMHLYFFHVRRLSWGPYVVVSAGTGP